MDVDDSSGEGIEHRIFEHAHVTREDYEIDSGTAQLVHQILLAIARKSRLKACLLDRLRANPGIARQSQNACVCHVGANDHDPGIEPARLDRFKDGTEVRPLSRTEDTEV